MLLPEPEDELHYLNTPSTSHASTYLSMRGAAAVPPRVDDRLAAMTDDVLRSKHVVSSRRPTVFKEAPSPWRDSYAGESAEGVTGSESQIAFKNPAMLTSKMLPHSVTTQCHCPSQSSSSLHEMLLSQ